MELTSLQPLVARHLLELGTQNLAAATAVSSTFLLRAAEEHRPEPPQMAQQQAAPPQEQPSQVEEQAEPVHPTTAHQEPDQPPEAVAADHIRVTA